MGEDERNGNNGAEGGLEVTSFYSEYDYQKPAAGQFGSKSFGLDGKPNEMLTLAGNTSFSLNMYGAERGYDQLMKNNLAAIERSQAEFRSFLGEIRTELDMRWNKYDQMVMKFNRAGASEATRISIEMQNGILRSRNMLSDLEKTNWTSQAELNAFVNKYQAANPSHELTQVVEQVKSKGVKYPFSSLGKLGKALRAISRLLKGVFKLIAFQDVIKYAAEAIQCYWNGDFRAGNLALQKALAKGMMSLAGLAATAVLALIETVWLAVALTIGVLIMLVCVDFFLWDDEDGEPCFLEELLVAHNTYEESVIKRVQSGTFARPNMF